MADYILKNAELQKAVTENSSFKALRLLFVEEITNNAFVAGVKLEGTLEEIIQNIENVLKLMKEKR